MLRMIGQADSPKDLSVPSPHSLDTAEGLTITKPNHLLGDAIPVFRGKLLGQRLSDRLDVGRLGRKHIRLGAHVTCGVKGPIGLRR
jgi:hypothetical protein